MSAVTRPLSLIRSRYLRRIDLITALVGPLFVSLLTTAGSYVSAASFLLGFGLVSGLVEFFWIQVVFSRCPILATEEHIRNRDRAQARVEAADKRRELSLAQRFGQAARTVGPSLRQSGADWHNFVRQPVFASSLALALLYLTVLSYVTPHRSALLTPSFQIRRDSPRISHHAQLVTCTSSRSTRGPGRVRTGRDGGDALCRETDRADPDWDVVNCVSPLDL